ncbi:MAG: acyl-CoA thioesterase/BAAT N-terminal domain-containing protein [Pseudomonadota bacterium]
MQKSITVSCLVCLLTAIAFGHAAEAQTFEIDTRETLYAGDPVSIVLSGLPPQSEVELRARRVLKNHYASGAPTQVYTSSARFLVNGEGRIDLSTSAAIDGTYQGVDPNGLFWSMRPVSDKTAMATPTIELDAIIDGDTVASTAFDLVQVPEAYSVQDVPSLPGSYFAPNPDAGDHPVIIVVGGADKFKINREIVMPQLVAQGYSVFYFANYEIIYGPSEPTVKELPTRYVSIPIDQLQDVYDWLVEQPGVDEHQIGLYGHSRNSAFALLAATRFDWVDAVAAIAPSDVVWEGWGDQVELGTTSSYSWQGEPFAFLPYSDNWYRETAKFGRGERGRLRTPMDEGRWQNPDRVAEARIPIEQYSGAVLVAGGEQDDLWSAGHMSQNIAERRAEAGLATKLLVFPNAGHALLGDGQNPIVLLFETDEARPILAKAQSKTWQATLELFETALKPH